MEICRVCGGVEVLKCFMGNNQLIELLRVCANIEVKEDDILPKHICEQCEFGLRFSYRLRKQSEETEKRLRQEVMQTQIISTTTTDIQDCTNLASAAQIPEHHSAITESDKTIAKTSHSNTSSKISNICLSIVEEQSAQERQVSTSMLETKKAPQIEVVEIGEIQQTSERFRLELEQRGVEMHSVKNNFLNERKIATEKVIAEKRIQLDQNEIDYTYDENVIDDNDVIELVHESIIHGSPLQEPLDDIDFSTTNYDAKDIVEEIILSDDDEKIQTNNINGVVYEEVDDEYEDSIGIDDCQIQIVKEEQESFNFEDYTKNVSIKLANNKPSLENVETNLEIERISNGTDDQKVLEEESSTSKTNIILKVSGYTCPTCNLELKTQREYRDHIKIHGNKRFHCAICDKWFAKRYRLDTHSKVHEINRSRVPCPLCERTYQIGSNLTRHMNTSHKSSSVYICSVCGARFSRLDVFNNHMDTHSNEPQFQCDKCPDRFKSKSYLNKHMSIHRKPTCESDETSKTDDNDDDGCKSLTTEKMYKCHVCGKQSKHHFTHKMHMRIHSQDRPHKCESCGKAFRTLAALITHERIHADARPFQCEHCLLSFRQRAHLKEHRMIHEGVTPHICSICKLSFTKKHNMIVHMRIHSGENPYKCVICAVEFKKLTQLRKHEQKIHNKDISEKDKETENDNNTEEASDMEDREKDVIEGGELSNNFQNYQPNDNTFTSMLCSDSNSIEIVENDSSLSIAGNVTINEMGQMQNGMDIMSGMMTGAELEQCFSNVLSDDYHIDNNDVVLIVDDNAKFNSLFIMDD